MNRHAINLFLAVVLGMPSAVLFFSHVYYPALALFLPDGFAKGIAGAVGIATYIAWLAYLISRLFNSCDE